MSTGTFTTLHSYESVIGLKYISGYNTRSLLLSHTAARGRSVLSVELWRHAAAAARSEAVQCQDSHRSTPLSITTLLCASGLIHLRGTGLRPAPRFSSVPLCCVYICFEEGPILVCFSSGPANFDFASGTLSRDSTDTGKSGLIALC